MRWQIFRAVEYYVVNKDDIKEKGKNKLRSILEKGKEAKRKYNRNRYKSVKEDTS